jgi:glycosyltransferase involved in cell wall biosynthesis/predicted SAM-dependent methyltransferase
MNNALNRLQFENDLPYGFSNKKATGVMPNPLPERVFLNLGCGKDIRDGFINIDLFSDDPRVVYGDVRKLDLPDNSADLILASDILEHFSHRETQSILNEWARVLKPGGELIIRCPSLRLQVNAYVNGIWNADVASYMIFGGQTNPGDYHCVAFDEQSIKDKLHKAGLIVTEFYEEDTPQDRGFINLNMTVRAIKKKIDQELFESTPLPEVIAQEEQQGSTQNEDFFDIDDLLSLSDDLTTSENDIQNEIIANEKEIETNKPQLNIVWEGSQFVYHSLALINREHCLNIIETEAANLTIVPYEPDAFSPDLFPKYKKLKENDIRYKQDVPDDVARLPYIWIRHQWPPKAEPPKGAKWIIMQPWEYNVHLVDFVEIFKQAVEIWTPSNFSRQSFINSGIDFDKVQVIPNGIDPVLFKPFGEKYPLNTNKRLKFLYLGGTIYRKGFDILLSAYMQTFTANDDVCLVVKDMGGDSFYRGQTAKDMILRAKQNPNAPEIIYIDDSMSEEEIASLYRACDVFVSPYRGEGFSLPTLEAMACGLPVVVTRGGATDDFTDEKCAWYLPAEKINIGKTLDGKLFTNEAYLLEPDRDYLAATLKYIFANPTEVYSAGLIASSKARKFWTWRNSTIKLLSRIDYLQGTNLAQIAEKKLPVFADDYIILGFAENEFISGNYENAIGLFSSLIEETPLLDDFSKTHILNRMAQYHLLNGNFDESERIINTIKQYYRPNLDTDYLFAKILKAKNRNDEAFELLTQIFDRWTEEKFNCTLGEKLDDILTFCGEISLEEDDLEGAHQYFSAALKLNPENARACLGAGKCFERIGHYESAKTMFEWAKKLDKSYKD